MSHPQYWQAKLGYWLQSLSTSSTFRGEPNTLQHTITALLPELSFSNPAILAKSLTQASLPDQKTVSFEEQPVLSHPIVPSKLKLPALKVSNATLLEELSKQLDADIRILKQSDHAPNDSEGWAQRLCHYLFFALSNRLSCHEQTALGGLWRLLPADPRLPDQSIWTDTALKSATHTAQIHDSDQKSALMVFSIGPVQAFIAKARKLRDHWVGSVLLSHLSFVGLKTVMSRLGPDHVIYPSLHNQSLIEDWLTKTQGISTEWLNKRVKGASDVASLPNKFVFLCPFEQHAELGQAISTAINQEWHSIASMVQKWISTSDKVKELFEHQCQDYWQFRWAAAELVSVDQAEALSELLDQEKWANEKESIDAFSAFTQSQAAEGDAPQAHYYSASHSLIQSALAASKFSPHIRASQHGEKCPLCGEHEILHDFMNAGKTSANEYHTATQKFWRHVYQKGRIDTSTFKEGERLCAICAVKRLLPMVLSKESSLYSILRQSDAFPSTTQMAMFEFFERNSVAESQRQKVANLCHDLELSSTEKDDEGLFKEIQAHIGSTEKIHNSDKYYAILLMDGDKMGDLINGQNFTSTWKDLLHPQISNADLSGTPFCFEQLGDKVRTVDPGVHTVISDALNGFSRFAVPQIVEKYSGRLIYAGGDDVCAIMPVSTVLQAANEISEAYNLPFVSYTPSAVTAITDCDDTPHQMGFHLGSAKGISISAGIVIAHHKQPLREVLKAAHHMLDAVAKRQMGRDAIAIRLQKRSGGARDFACKWQAENPFIPKETLLDSLESISRHVGSDISNSLLYRLESLRDALVHWQEDIKAHQSQIIRMFAYELKHSGLWNKDDLEYSDRLARQLAGLAFQHTADGRCLFSPETLIMTAFLAKAQTGGQQ